MYKKQMMHNIGPQTKINSHKQDHNAIKLVIFCFHTSFTAFFFLKPNYIISCNAKPRLEVLLVFKTQLFFYFILTQNI
jgi:hypothetical protein